MSSSNILLSIDRHVATITLDRGARHNALTMAMLADVDLALAKIENARDVRVAVFRSTSPRFFCSGADIEEWGDIDPEGMGSRFIRAGNRVFRRIAELDIPTISVLSGSALGGGLELALSCDFRYASTSAMLGFPEASVGAIPGWMGCQRLSDLVGAGRSRELVLLGEPITAARAAVWGMVTEALPREQLDARVAEICALLQRRSSASLSVGKRLLRMVESGQAELAHEFAASVCKATPDALEGVRAFREKRDAEFG
ncbi:enoyl-CoA hydratase/isomerase family protein [Caballeronia sp. 15715]|uniref:enoyl-CoA hydratase/isomerase family protein n=1 Tax=unclassified Caballeronia TaxID=2646786 RepID=UPI0039E520B1